MAVAQMTALIRQLALVSESKLILMSDVMKVSAALQKQATRDLAPIWDISATVDAFDKLDDVPVGYWPLIIQDDIDTAGAAGIHKDENGQPMALITASADINTWSLTASHEALEMLVDPSGDRLVAGDSPKSDQGRVSFLVEVCDPVEASNFAYSVNGVLVSDFYTPHYFDPVQSPGVRYSYTGALTEPRQVLSGGYLSWVDPTSNTWWQETFFDGDQPDFRSLGQLNTAQGESLRTLVDGLSSTQTRQAIARGRGGATAAGLELQCSAKASISNATGWRRKINQLLAQGSAKAAKHGRRPVPKANPPEQK
jgi:hypothetical protein